MYEYSTKDLGVTYNALRSQALHLNWLLEMVSSYILSF